MVVEGALHSLSLSEMLLQTVQMPIYRQMCKHTGVLARRGVLPGGEKERKL